MGFDSIEMNLVYIKVNTIFGIIHLDMYIQKNVQLLFRLKKNPTNDCFIV